MRLPSLRLLLPFVGGIALCDHSFAPPGLWLAAAVLSASGLVWPRGRRAAEVLLGLSLGGLALAVRLHAPVPELDARSPSVAFQLLEAPRRSGPTCAVVVWLFSEVPGRALLRTSESLCERLPGDRAVARIELTSFSGPRNPGGGSAQRAWRRRGVRRIARVLDGLRAPVVTKPGLRAHIERLRRRVAETLDPQHAGGRAGALLRALVTGRREAIDPELRAIFTRSGTAHLLAVSGLHVACVFAALSFVLVSTLSRAPWISWVRRARIVGIVVGVAGAGAYAVLSGLGVPALRATAMAAAGTWALLSGRPAASANALALAALLVLAVDPASLFDAGFALSFSAVAGILAWRPPARGVGAGVHVTLAAGLATAPWVAALGLPLAAAGLLANLGAVPVFGFAVVPLGLLTGVAGSVFPSLGAILRPACFAITETAIRALEAWQAPDLLAEVSAPLALALSISLCGFALRGFWLSRNRALLGLAAVAGGVAFLASAPPRNEIAEHDELHFFDVGHGDAVLLRSRDRAWLVDAGPRLGSFDAGARVVAPALAALGVRRLDVLVVTHLDRDHAGGVRSILERIGVGEIWLTEAAAAQAAGRALRRSAARRGVVLRIAGRGDRARIGALEVAVLWPPRGFRPRASNDASLVLRVEGAAGCALLPGDVPARIEQELGADLRPCALLKLAHHGSGSSTGETLLQRMRPWIGVASAGRRRRGALPHPSVRARLSGHHVTLYETREHGAVRVSFTPYGLVVAPFVP